MVQTWKSEDAEDHVCRNCGARYEVRVTRLPARERDSGQCERWYLIVILVTLANLY